jgi:methionyl-tRNA formyltransferase
MTLNKSRVLFLGRKNDECCNKAYIFLKKNFSNVKVIWSKSPNEKNHLYFKKEFDYIFALRSYFILKKETLARIKKVAINFHPAIPKYRGFAPANYAILNSEIYYGCTAHIMHEKIDSGPIINVLRFKISKKDSLKKILLKTYAYQLKQFKTLISKIAKKEESLLKFIEISKKEKWGNKIKTKKDIDSLYEIDLKKSKIKIINHLRATLLENSIFHPYLLLNNKRYLIIKDKE